MVEMIERTTALIALPDGAEAAVGAALGRALPAMGRFEETDGLILARVAPHQVFAMRHGVDQPLMQDLADVEECAGLIDLSDARVGVRTGRAGLELLVPLDLDRFEIGACAQTLMAHMSVLVLRHGPDAFELQVARSYAGSFLRAVQSPGATH